MLLSNIKFRPVRLQVKRACAGLWHLYRDSKPLGTIERIKEENEVRWITEKNIRVRPTRRNPPSWGHTSFIAAALHLARSDRAFFTRNKPQDYGYVQMSRFNISGKWYAVILDRNEDIHVYPEPFVPYEPTFLEQSILRKLIASVEQWKRDNRND